MDKSSKKKKNGNKKKFPKGKPNPNAKIKKLMQENLKLKEMYKNDIRGPRSIPMKSRGMIQNRSIPIIVDVDANKFQSVIIGAVNTAVYRGWSINTQNDSFPYWAKVYQSDLLKQAAEGGVPFTGNVPFWLATVIQAVIKTTSSQRDSKFSYQMNVTGNLDTDYEQIIGPPVYKFVYSLGVKVNTTLVNGWPTIAPPAAYTVENGQRATQAMWLFMQQIFPNDPMHKLVPFNDTNKLTHDSSAFAFFQNTPGGGFEATGAYFKIVQHEVPIRFPLYSIFASIDITPPRNRAPRSLQLFGGDGITLGSMLTKDLQKKNLSINAPIRTSFIDFNEILNVYSLVIQKVIRLRLQTNEFVQNVLNNGTYYDEFVKCPLTFLEFSLLLKASLMLIFTDNMAMQGVYPRVPTTQNDNEFVVYPTGINTYPIAMGNMMYFPKLLEENIMALRSRYIETKTGNRVYYKAALGQYAADKLEGSAYQVTYIIENSPPIINDVFTVKPGEVDISLVDGASGINSVAINEPEQLVQLAEAFNEWVQGMGDHFRQPTTLSPDAGIRELSVIGMNAHWVSQGKEIESLGKEIIPPDAARARGKGLIKQQKLTPSAEKYANTVTGKPDDEVKPIINSKYRKGETKYEAITFYDDRLLLAYTSQGEFFMSQWTQFQQYFVVPINKIDAPELPLGDSTGFNRIAGLMDQTKQIDVGAGSVQFTDLGERHENFSNLMVKTKFAMKTTQQSELDHLTNEGNAGILGKIGSAMIGNLGHPAVDVAQELAQMIPY